MSRRVSLLVRLPLPKQRGAGPPNSSAPSTSRAAAFGLAPNADSSDSPTMHFTQSELALALAIQKSKPKDLSTNDYLQQLQNHVKIGRKQLPNDARYIDSCEFWKEQCNKVHLEKKGLEDKIRCLEEANRQLRNGLPKSPPDEDRDLDTDESFGNSSSTIHDSADRSRAAPSRKRPAATDEESHVETLSYPVLELPFADDQLLRLTSYTLQIKRQRNKLEKACQESNTLIQIENITSQTIRMLALLETSLSDCFLPFKFLRTDHLDKHMLDLLQRVVHQIGLSFRACFIAFNELCRTIPGRSKKSELVFHLVTFFNKSLDFLKKVCGLQEVHEIDQHNRRPRDKRLRVEEGEYSVNKYLAKMLASIAYGLEWKVGQPGHGDLLEGILFSVLKHTGRLVSEVVFGEHVASSDNPGNITESINLTPSQGGRSEARYIVQVLHAALGGTDRRYLIAQILADKKTNVAAPETALGGGLPGTLFLLSKARKLLQSTLMRNTVGGEELETLRLPTPPLETTEVPDTSAIEVEHYGPDWLIETVWALIGWDLID